jgi:GlpG protein|tara:strand:+ start:1157 stop:1783 length:627 start_codon:yes stop_codon:yes gene_type:complete
LNIKNIHLPIILVAIALALVSNFGSIISIIEPLTFLKIDTSRLGSGYISYASFNNTYFINNEWWRLITPMILHFSFAHLAFNCLWIYVLGSKIELYDGNFLFLILVLVSSMASNFFQFYFSDPSIFGGLSGVIYGMFGYCMVIELERDRERYGLPPAIYLFMIVWLVLGFLGILDLFGFGSVANFAHLGGLISGLIFGMIAKSIKLYS